MIDSIRIRSQKFLIQPKRYIVPVMGFLNSIFHINLPQKILKNSFMATKVKGVMEPDVRSDFDQPIKPDQ